MEYTSFERHQLHRTAKALTCGDIFPFERCCVRCNKFALCQRHVVSCKFRHVEMLFHSNGTINPLERDLTISIKSGIKSIFFARHKIFAVDLHLLLDRGLTCGDVQFEQLVLLFKHDQLGFDLDHLFSCACRYLTRGTVSCSN